MKKKVLALKENIFFVVTAIILLAFQLGVYAKLCRMPRLWDYNMLILYLMYANIFLIKNVKSKMYRNLLFLIYLIYFAIVAGFFIEAMFNPNVNCDGLIYVTLSELASI